MSSEIKVDTISEQTSANGVAIDSLGIKDGKITNLMNATLSAADLGSGVHIKTADTSGSVSTNADELVIEGTRSGMTFLAANDNFSYINFGDDGGADRGTIRYGHSADSFSFQTAATEAMAISSDGEVTKPLQPCFRIGSGTQNDIPVSANQTGLFDVEIFDVGSNFASSIFTAPVTGKYFLNVMYRIQNLDSASSYLQVSILGSNRNTTVFTLSSISNHLNGDDEISFSGATILDMDANDTAQVRIRIQAGTAQADVSTDGSYFTGYLIG